MTLFCLCERILSAKIVHICDRLHFDIIIHWYLTVRLHLECRWYKYGCLTTSSMRISLNSMFAWIVSRGSVLSNIRCLPIAQLSLPLYLLYSVHKTSSCLVVIKTTLPRVPVACWVIFISLPAYLFSTFLIFISRLLHIYCLLAFGHFKPATYCSFLVLCCP